MFKAICDLIYLIVFWGVISMGAHSFYSYVKVQTLNKIHQGLNPITPFTKALTGKTFDWEKDDFKKK